MSNSEMAGMDRSPNGVQPIKLGNRLTLTSPPFESWLSDEVEFELYTDPTWSYVVGYSHVDVGLVSYAAFATLSDLYDWLETQGAEFVSREIPADPLCDCGHSLTRHTASGHCTASGVHWHCGC